MCCTVHYCSWEVLKPVSSLNAQREEILDLDSHFDYLVKNYDALDEKYYEGTFTTTKNYQVNYKIYMKNYFENIFSKIIQNSVRFALALPTLIGLHKLYYSWHQTYSTPLRFPIDSYSKQVVQH